MALGLLSRTFRSHTNTVIFEDRPYTWHSDVDLSQGDLVSFKVDGDAIDDDHMKYVGKQTDRGVKQVIEFDHAVAGPVKDAKLIDTSDKVTGEQSSSVGVYTLATKEEFDAMKPKIKAQVTCPNYLAFVGVAVAFEVEEIATLEDLGAEAEAEGVVKDFPGNADFDTDAETNDVLVLGDDHRADNDPAP